VKPFFSRSFFRKRFFKGFKESFNKETSYFICNEEMQNVMRKTEMLNKALEILPATEEDIVLTGIISKIEERIAELKKAGEKLIEK